MCMVLLDFFETKKMIIFLKKSSMELVLQNALLKEAQVASGFSYLITRIAS